VAFDGSHLFIWDPLEHCVRKIGSGLNGTIKGAEIHCYRNIVDQIRSRKGLSVDVENASKKMLQASLCCIDRFLYFTSAELLGAGQIAAFSVKTLLLESIRKVNYGTPTTVIELNDSVVKESTFIFEHTEVVDIRTCKGYSVRVKSAVFHEVDCTEIISNLVSTCDTVIHFGDIVTLLGDPAPGMPKQLGITVECLPISTAISDVADIEIVSAYFYDSNFGGSNIVEVVRAQFNAFMGTWAPGSKSCQQVNLTWLTDNQPDVQKTLWVNFKLSGQADDTIQTVSFLENSLAAWESIPAATNADLVFNHESMHEGLTSDGRYLIALNSKFAADRSTRQVVYNAVKDVIIGSAYFYDTNYCGPDIAPLIRENYEKYLNAIQMGSQEEQTASSSWLPDNQNGVPKTLWINFQVGSNQKLVTVAFAEGETIQWSVILRHAYAVFSGFDSQLEAIMVDPMHDMNISRRCGIALPSSMYDSCTNLNRNTNLISNGQKLIIHQLQNGGRTEQKLKLQVFNFDICGQTAALLSSSTEEYDATEFYPFAFTYDSATNYVWSWDFISRRFARWRNTGLRPQKATFEKNATLISSNPSVRLQCLWPDKKSTSLASGSSREQAMVLSSVLDKLSEPYAPLQPGLSQEVYPSNEIELISKGLANSVRGYSVMKVRGTAHGNGEKPDLGPGRCYNVITLTEGYLVDEYRNFDTVEFAANVDSLTDYLNGLPEGKLVLISTNTSACQNLNLRAFNALRSVGADTAGLERNLASNILYESFALIGRKGSKPGTAIQKLGKEGKQVIVRARIPSRNIPLAVELTGTNIGYLVNAVIRNHQSWSAHGSNGSSDAAGAVILISTIHILTVHVHQLLSGITDKQAEEYFAGCNLSQLRATLGELIDKDSTDPQTIEISKAALKLFIEALNLLCPTIAERQSLLLNYLKQYVRNELSSQEGKILQLLLSRVRSPKELVPIVHGEDTHAITDLLACLMTVMKTELPKQLGAVIESRRADRDRSVPLKTDSNSALFEAAVGLTSALSKMLLSRAVQEIVIANEAKSLEGEVRGKRGGFTFISMVSTMVESCGEILSEISAANQKLCPTGDTLDPEIEELVHSSLVGSLLPYFFSSASMVFKTHGVQLLQWVDSNLLTGLHTSLTTMARAVQLLIKCLPRKLMFSSSVTTARKIEKVFESAHPYDNNMDTTTEISIPGAKKLVVIFDPVSRTENNCDYVRFLDMNGNSLHPTIEKFCGRDGSQNWPGCEGRPELELECNPCRMTFHSDGSVTDWGFKFTVVGMIAGASTESHWLISMEQLIVECKTSLAISYINSIPWNEALEDPLNVWMNEPIVQPELFNGKIGNSEEDQFLLDLTTRPSGSAAESFANFMKKRVREDQGADEIVNKSVYATCAAIIKLNNLTAEALAIAKKSRSDCSPAMVKAWTAGQKMRAYFDLADAQSGGAVVARQDSANLPSLYSGANPEVLAAAAQETVARAQFLIRSSSEEAEETALRPSSPRAQAMVRSTSYLAKQRWGLLAKSEGLQRQDSGDNKRRLSWSSLVTNVVVSDKVKSILEFRKKSAVRKKGKQSVTERILAFIQSRVTVDQLEQMSSLRSKRAGLRAQGISMLAQSLEPSGFPTSLCWILYSFANALRRNPHGDSAAAHRVHYGAIVEGSVPKVQESLACAFGEFVERALAVLEAASINYSRSGVTDAERSAWCNAVVACLRALALDYQENDHVFLEKSQLLKLIGDFSSWENDNVREVSQSLLEILVDRCVAGNSKASQDPLCDHSEPTPFSMRLIEFVTDRVKSFADTSQEMTSIAPVAAAGTCLVPQVLNLYKSSVEGGYSRPHVPVGLSHTFSVWIKRPASLKLDTGNARIVTGSEVIRGPAWSAGNQDGGIGTVGTVANVDSNGNASVVWPNGTTVSYKISESEVLALADKGVGGIVLSKGLPALYSDKDLRARPPPWALFGLELFSDGTVGYFISNGKSKFYNKSKQLLAPDVWNHVTVVQQKQTNVIYINGSNPCEALLEESLLTTSTSQTLESSHPYPDNLDTYQFVEFPGANKLTVTFDEQSRTEQGCDYVKFYKNDSRNEAWGENYSGRDGSRYGICLLCCHSQC
jgi:hypothetical protein